MLSVDDREPKSIQTLFDEKATDVKVIVKRLPRGDYAFYRNDVLLFVIERKTWADLAASLSDGRLHCQLEDLTDLWETDNEIYVFMLIEGKWNSSIRIPRNNLERKVTSIMFKYPFIQFINTRSKDHTVSKILELCDMAPVPEKNDDGNGGNDANEEKKNTLGGEGDGNRNGKENGKERKKDILQKKPLTTGQLALKALMTIPSININTATPLISNFCMYELFDLKSPDQLSELKYPSGRRIGGTRASKLFRTLGRKKNVIRFISGINGITKPTATNIVEQMDSIPYSEWSVGRLSQVTKPSGKKIGYRTSVKCFDIWCYRS